MGEDVNTPWTYTPEWLTDELKDTLTKGGFSLDQDGLLLLHKRTKEMLDYWKEEEITLRKILAKVLIPEATKHEGINTIPLGAGYEAKVGIKYNYSLLENDKVDIGLEKISKLDNEGAFIADRLVNWHPTLSISEYKEIQDRADKGSQIAKDIIKIIYEFLIIKEATPTLEIKTPKEKKK